MKEKYPVHATCDAVSWFSNWTFSLNKLKIFSTAHAPCWLESSGLDSIVVMGKSAFVQPRWTLWWHSTACT